MKIPDKIPEGGILIPWDQIIELCLGAYETPDDEEKEDGTTD